LTIILVVVNGFLDLDSGIIATCLKIASFGVNVFWIYFMVRESKFNKTIFGRLTLIFISVIIIGFLFKLQHWANAGTLLIFGYVGIMITYTIRFIAKKQKLLLDIFKLIWVETTALISLLVLMHRIDRDYTIINSLLFIAVICLFTLDYNKQKNVGRK
jgi:hypothetical protein